MTRKRKRPAARSAPRPTPIPHPARSAAVPDRRGYKKLGAPEDGEEREPLMTTSFKADAETLAAIDALTEAATTWGIVRPRSVAIRRALIDAAERLRTKPAE